MAGPTQTWGHGESNVDASFMELSNRIEKEVVDVVMTVRRSRLVITGTESDLRANYHLSH